MKKDTYILAIETSCDETSVAISRNGYEILSNVFATSEELHEITGGVVPEVASRKHLESIIPVVYKALEKANTDLSKIDYIAVTNGPGLQGSLLVGVDFAKTLSLILDIPIIPVNHLYAHIYAGLIGFKNINFQKDIYPSLGVVVSGGHTDLVLLKSHFDKLYLGGTRDDAVGESFDKVARILGIARYMGGGPAVDKLALKGCFKQGFKLPRPMIHSQDLDFSFSGLKTAVKIANEKGIAKEAIAYEFQKSVVEVLMHKIKKAFYSNNCKKLLIGGGVIANRELRSQVVEEFGDNVFLPEMQYCLDNAGMIAYYAYILKDKFATKDLASFDADSSLAV